MGNGFRELKVWHEAKSIAVDVYKLIRSSPKFFKDWGLRDQMQRAAVSISSNIVEGDARKSNKDSIRFFHIASGSFAELITQLEIVKDLEKAEEGLLNDLINRLETLSRSIGSLIRARNVS